MSYRFRKSKCHKIHIHSSKYNFNHLLLRAFTKALNVDVFPENQEQIHEKIKRSLIGFEDWNVFWSSKTDWQLRWTFKWFPMFSLILWYLADSKAYNHFENLILDSKLQATKAYKLLGLESFEVWTKFRSKTSNLGLKIFDKEFRKICWKFWEVCDENFWSFYVSQPTSLRKFEVMSLR